MTYFYQERHRAKLHRLLGAVTYLGNPKVPHQHWSLFKFLVLIIWDAKDVINSTKNL